MNDCDFSKRVFSYLSDEERKEVLKKSILEGFTVNGFSRKPYDAPLNAILSSFNCKRGKKYQYEILLSVMKEVADEEGASDLLNLVKQWVESFDKHEEIEKILACYNQEEKIIEKEEDNKIFNSDRMVEQLEKQSKELVDELKVAREKIKQHKHAIQDNKIEIDNLKQEITKLKKDEKQAQVINEELRKEIMKITEERDEVIGILNDKNHEMEELKKIIELLKSYKENAPRILCIIKKEETIEIPGYDITTIHNWNDEIKKEIKGGEYTKIWLVHNGFTYDVISDIKLTFDIEMVKEYSNYSNLIKNIGNGGNL